MHLNNAKTVGLSPLGILWEELDTDISVEGILSGYGVIQKRVRKLVNRSKKRKKQNGRDAP